MIHMRAKYVEERFPRLWMWENELMIGSNFAEMEDAVHNDALKHEMLVKMALRFAEVAPEEFTKLWYGQ